MNDQVRESCSPPSLPGPDADRGLFYRRAATISVCMVALPFIAQPISAFLMLLPFDYERYVVLSFSILVGLGVLAGVLLGMIGLSGIFRYGAKGILVKSLIGILVPTLLVAISIPALLHAREMALRNQARLQTESGR